MSDTIRPSESGGEQHAAKPPLQKKLDEMRATAGEGNKYSFLEELKKQPPEGVPQDEAQLGQLRNAMIDGFVQHDLVPAQLGVGYQNVAEMARILSQEDFKQVFEQYKTHLQIGIKNGSFDKNQQKWAKEWISFIDDGKQDVAYQTANLDAEKTLAEKDVSPREMAKAMAKGIAHAVKNFKPKEALKNLVDVRKYPGFVKRYLKAYNVFDKDNRNIEYFAGLTVGAAENFIVTTTTTGLPHGRALKAAFNAAAMGGIYGASGIAHGKQEKGLMRKVVRNEITQQEFELKYFDLKTNKKRADRRLRNFARGLAGGSGFTAIGFGVESMLTQNPGALVNVPPKAPDAKTLAKTIVHKSQAPSGEFTMLKVDFQPPPQTGVEPEVPGGENPPPGELETAVQDAAVALGKAKDATGRDMEITAGEVQQSLHQTGKEYAVRAEDTKNILGQTGWGLNRFKDHVGENIDIGGKMNDLGTAVDTNTSQEVKDAAAALGRVKDVAWSEAQKKYHTDIQPGFHSTFGEVLKKIRPEEEGFDGVIRPSDGKEDFDGVIRPSDEGFGGVIRGMQGKASEGIANIQKSLDIDAKIRQYIRDVVNEEMGRKDPFQVPPQGIDSDTKVVLPGQRRVDLMRVLYTQSNIMDGGYTPDTDGAPIVPDYNASGLQRMRAVIPREALSFQPDQVKLPVDFIKAPDTARLSPDVVKLTDTVAAGLQQAGLDVGIRDTIAQTVNTDITSIETALQQQGIPQTDTVYTTVVAEARKQLENAANGYYTQSLAEAIGSLTQSLDGKEKALVAKLVSKSPEDLQRMFMTLQEASALQGTNPFAALGKVNEAGLSIDEAKTLQKLSLTTQRRLSELLQTELAADKISEKAASVAKQTAEAVQEAIPAPIDQTPVTIPESAVATDTLASVQAPAPDVATIVRPNEGSPSTVTIMDNLLRTGQDAQAILLRQPEVQHVLTTTLEKHGEIVDTFVQEVAKAAVGSEVRPPTDEELRLWEGTVRQFVKERSAEAFNTAFAESMTALDQAIHDPAVIAEVQSLLKQNPQALMGRIATALENPDSEDAKKYGPIVTNVQQHLERLYSEGLKDTKLRTNLSDMIHEGITSLRSAVDAYEQQGTLPVPLSNEVLHVIGTNAEAVGKTVGPVAMRVYQELAQQEAFRGLMEGKMSETVDVAQRLTNDVLQQYNLQPIQLSPDIFRTVSTVVKERIAYYGDVRLTTALEQLAKTDLAIFDKIGAMSPVELAQQIQDAFDGKENVLSPLVREMQEAYQAFVESPQAQKIVVSEIRAVLDQAEVLNNTYLRPVGQSIANSGLPTDTTTLPPLVRVPQSITDVPMQSGLPIDHAVQQGAEAAPEGAVAIAGEVAGAPLTADRLQFLGERALGMALKDPAVQGFLQQSIAQHSQTVEGLAQKIANDAGYTLTAPTAEQLSFVRTQAQAYLRGLAGEQFNRAVDESLAALDETAMNPDFVARLQGLSQNNPAAFAQEVTRLLTTAQTDPQSAEGLFAKNVQSHLERLYTEAAQDPILRNNVADLANEGIDAAEQAVKDYVQYPNIYEQGTPLPSIDGAVVASGGQAVNTLVGQVQPVAERIAVALANDPEMQAEWSAFLGRQVGENIDSTGALLNDVLRANGLDPLSMTPAAIRSTIHYTQNELAGYADSSVQLSLEALANTDDATFDRIRAMSQEEFNRQFLEALNNPDATGDVADLVHASTSVYEAAMRNPELRNYIAVHANAALEQLRVLNNTVLRVPSLDQGDAGIPVDAAAVQAPVLDAASETLAGALDTAGENTQNVAAETMEADVHAGENVDAATQELLQQIEAVPSQEIPLHSGDTVSRLLSQHAGKTIAWNNTDSSLARVFGAHIAANYDTLQNMWNRLEATGETPTRVDLATLGDLITKAEQGDDAALTTLRNQALHWIPQEGTFKILRDDEIPAMMKVLHVEK